MKARLGFALLAAAAAGCGPSAEIVSLTPSEVMSVSAWLTAHVPGAVAARAVATAPDGQEVRTPPVKRPLVSGTFRDSGGTLVPAGPG